MHRSVHLQVTRGGQPGDYPARNDEPHESDQAVIRPWGQPEFGRAGDVEAPESSTPIRQSSSLYPPPRTHVILCADLHRDAVVHRFHTPDDYDENLLLRTSFHNHCAPHCATTPVRPLHRTAHCATRHARHDPTPIRSCSQQSRRWRAKVGPTKVSGAPHRLAFCFPEGLMT